jgi:hypothetical protein
MSKTVKDIIFNENDSRNSDHTPRGSAGNVRPYFSQSFAAPNTGEKVVAKVDGKFKLGVVKKVAYKGTNRFYTVKLLCGDTVVIDKESDILSAKS